MSAKPRRIYIDLAWSFVAAAFFVLSVEMVFGVRFSASQQPVSRADSPVSCPPPLSTLEEGSSSSSLRASWASFKGVKVYFHDEEKDPGRREKIQIEEILGQLKDCVQVGESYTIARETMSLEKNPSKEAVHISPLESDWDEFLGSHEGTKDTERVTLEDGRKQLAKHILAHFELSEGEFPHTPYSDEAPEFLPFAHEPGTGGRPGRVVSVLRRRWVDSALWFAAGEKNYQGYQEKPFALSGASKENLARAALEKRGQLDGASPHQEDPMVYNALSGRPWKEDFGYVVDIDVTYKTPLHTAVFNGEVGVVSALLDFGADPRARNSEGWTAYHVAAMSERSYDVKLRILDVLNEKHDQMRARAGMGEDIPSWTEIVWEPPAVDPSWLREENNQFIPERLREAAKRALTERHHKNVVGFTPLHCACFWSPFKPGQGAVMDALVNKYRADPLAAAQGHGAEGLTPLHLLLQHKFTESAETGGQPFLESLSVLVHTKYETEFGDRDSGVVFHGSLSQLEDLSGKLKNRPGERGEGGIYEYAVRNQCPTPLDWARLEGHCIPMEAVELLRSVATWKERRGGQQTILYEVTDPSTVPAAPLVFIRKHTRLPSPEEEIRPQREDSSWTREEHLGATLSESLGGPASPLGGAAAERRRRREEKNAETRRENQKRWPSLWSTPSRWRRFVGLVPFLCASEG